jgi:alpha/beta superfamily hydrolase
MSDGSVRLPGPRDAVASHDAVAGRDADADACVVACPPHPEYGGHRGDQRLRAVADALGERGVATLRFDYGPWDRGRGEVTDARNAVAWTRERYDRIGLFGYSFGGAMALLAAAADADAGRDLAAVVALAPAVGVTDGVGRSVPGALADVTAPVRVVYGSRDTTADWEPIVERARELGLETVEMSADHHFVGQADKAADHAAEFLLGHL